MNRSSLFLGIVLLATNCKLPGVSPSSTAQFSSDPVAVGIQPGQIDEASGVVDSRTMPGNLWVHQDSGSPTEISLLGHDGKVKGKMAVPNTQNIDWEDMSSGPGPQNNRNYLYIGDIGDNNGEHPTRVVYRFPEPGSLSESIGQVERINYRYPDGPRDAEALFVDPQTKDIYIVSKRESRVRLYRLKYPQDINVVTVAEALGEIPLSVVTGAGISSDGSEILLRTYTNILYYKRSDGQSVADALQRQNSRALPYRLEPQGEAVCFDRENKGYYTLSERFNSPAISLYYYARK
ncbi:PE-PGRS family protein [Rudanella paleaurantiibacter]|uniref:PE-PGRS family protein n=1 Tax=Rudanella paleaurantiibacter TaxID=2614655 RepID=A0A7J5U5P2_9BACT|nr:PE-PGRS family protein [Rudanella paleaurantiibacter]KAB7733096.1 PE-PGRS family protein [Rudanella paleaurantiibacter]